MVYKISENIENDTMNCVTELNFIILIMLKWLTLSIQRINICWNTPFAVWTAELAQF